MNKTRSALFGTALLFWLTGQAFAACTPGSSWTAAWTDGFGQTTYTLSAPCKVYIGIPFSITAGATDSSFPNSDVGFGWSVLDNGSTIAGSGFNWVTTSGGQWQTVLPVTYTGTPIDHTIQFKFSDLGQGGGAHFWASSLIGDITVDPYPPSANTAPVVDAGPDIVLDSVNKSTSVVQGTATDADNDPLSYRWLEGTSVLQSSQAVDRSGNAPLNLATIPPLSVGGHTFTLEVSDGTSTSRDSMTLSIINSPPIVAPDLNGTFQAGQNIVLNADIADFDGDTVHYRWLEGMTELSSGAITPPAGGAPLALPEAVITGGLPLGMHTLTLEANDGVNTVTASGSIIVIDTTAPTIAPTASATILWPPNNAMQLVTIYANTLDNSNGPVQLSVVLSDSNPARNSKKGAVADNISLVSIDQSAGIITVKLRSSKAGKGGGHVYSIAITATDASGNTSTADVLVQAPRDRRKH